MKKGFTLIEILISISIIGILVTIAAFGLQGARGAARDAKRKTDLQTIKGALELYYSDCGYYPPAVTSTNSVPNPLVGDGVGRCALTNVYLSTVPTDPQYTTRSYYYSRPTNTSFVLCASLEEVPNPVSNTGCAGSNDCGTGMACNTRVAGP